MNLDDGALSAENAIAEMNAQKEMIDSSCRVDDSRLTQNLADSSKVEVVGLNSAHNSLSNQNSAKSKKNNSSAATTKLVNATGTDEHNRRSEHIDEVEDLQAVFPDEDARPRESRGEPPLHVHAETGHTDCAQANGGRVHPFEYQ